MDEGQGRNSTSALRVWLRYHRYFTVFPPFVTLCMVADKLRIVLVFARSCTVGFWVVFSRSSKIKEKGEYHMKFGMMYEIQIP